MTNNPNLKQHIFIVDDDKEDRELFSEALSYVNQNVKLIEISSGTKLIEALNNSDFPVPEIIFLDVNMPKLTGIDCLKKIKSSEKFKDLNIVILSTYSHKDDVEEAYRQGASRYYVKPTVFDNLKDIITGALDNVNNNNIFNKSNFFVKYCI